MKYKLTKIFIDKKEIKEGKYGKYQKMAVKVEEKGEQWYNGFCSYPDDKKRNWKVGDEVDIILEEKLVGDKIFYNFKLPKNSFGGLEDIKLRLDRLEQEVFGNAPSQPEILIDEEDDLPF